MLTPGPLISGSHHLPQFLIHHSQAASGGGRCDQERTLGLCLLCAQLSPGPTHPSVQGRMDEGELLGCQQDSRIWWGPYQLQLLDAQPRGGRGGRAVGVMPSPLPASVWPLTQRRHLSSPRFHFCLPVSPSRAGRALNIVSMQSLCLGLRSGTPGPDASAGPWLHRSQAARSPHVAAREGWGWKAARFQIRLRLRNGLDSGMQRNVDPRENCFQSWRAPGSHSGQPPHCTDGSLKQGVEHVQGHGLLPQVSNGSSQEAARALTSPILLTIS